MFNRHTNENSVLVKTHNRVLKFGKIEVNIWIF